MVPGAPHRVVVERRTHRPRQPGAGMRPLPPQDPRSGLAGAPRSGHQEVLPQTPCRTRLNNSRWWPLTSAKQNEKERNDFRSRWVFSPVSHDRFVNRPDTTKRLSIPMGLQPASRRDNRLGQTIARYELAVSLLLDGLACGALVVLDHGTHRGGRGALAGGRRGSGTGGRNAGLLGDHHLGVHRSDS